MKAAYVDGPSNVVIKNVEKPQIGNGDILVRMRACGICGSDLEKIYGQYSQSSMKLGHEPAGIISQIGSSVNNFKAGFHVIHAIFVYTEMKPCAGNIQRLISHLAV